MRQIEQLMARAKSGISAEMLPRYREAAREGVREYRQRHLLQLRSGVREARDAFRLHGLRVDLPRLQGTLRKGGRSLSRGQPAR